MKVKRDINSIRRFPVKENVNKKYSVREEVQMNKAELVAAMADQAGLSKRMQAHKAFTDVVSEELKKGGKNPVSWFGTLKFLKSS